MCVCVCDIFLFVSFFFFEKWEGNLDLGPVHPGNRLVLVINVLKLLLVEIAVKCVPLFRVACT